MAMAVSGRRVMQGMRKTTMCENALSAGRAYRSDVSDGVDVGSVMTGKPAGTMPTGCVDIKTVLGTQALCTIGNKVQIRCSWFKHVNDTTKQHRKLEQVGSGAWWSREMGSRPVVARHVVYCG